MEVARKETLERQVVKSGSFLPQISPSTQEMNTKRYIGFEFLETTEMNLFAAVTIKRQRIAKKRSKQQLHLNSAE